MIHDSRQSNNIKTQNQRQSPASTGGGQRVVGGTWQASNPRRRRRWVRGADDRYADGVEVVGNGLPSRLEGRFWSIEATALVIFCSSCVGKLTKIDLERSFEIPNAILQFDCRFCTWQVTWSVEKWSLRQFWWRLWFLTGCGYDLSFGYEYKLVEFKSGSSKHLEKLVCFMGCLCRIRPF